MCDDDVDGLEFGGVEEEHVACCRRYVGAGGWSV